MKNLLIALLLASPTAQAGTPSDFYQLTEYMNNVAPEAQGLLMGYFTREKFYLNRSEFRQCERISKRELKKEFKGHVASVFDWFGEEEAEEWTSNGEFYSARSGLIKLLGSGNTFYSCHTSDATPSDEVFYRWSLISEDGEKRVQMVKVFED